MSRSPSPSRPTGHPGLACYMAGVFSSSTRLCAHETGLVAGRLRVMAAVDLADPTDMAEARLLARQALSLERAAGMHYEAARRAYKHQVAYRLISKRTSAVAQLMARAAQFEVRGEGGGGASSCRDSRPRDPSPTGH